MVQYPHTNRLQNAKKNYLESGYAILECTHTFVDYLHICHRKQSRQDRALIVNSLKTMVNQSKTSTTGHEQKNGEGAFLTYSLSSLSSPITSFDVFSRDFSVFFPTFAMTSRNPATRFFSWATFSWTSFIALTHTYLSKEETIIENSTCTCLACHYHWKTHVSNTLDEGDSHQTGSALQDVDSFLCCFECIFFLEWHELASGRLFCYRIW